MAKRGSGVSLLVHWSDDPPGGVDKARSPEADPARLDESGSLDWFFHDPSDFGPDLLSRFYPCGTSDEGFGPRSASIEVRSECRIVLDKKGAYRIWQGEI